ncbi:hypothetical protein SAMN04488503_1607 [Humidesulfovibrio mexicanus]|uniref:MerR HTH family regulatory protein n=1 Tax=Humidesulfovibrio mexicanus TaxID=147047 RepID=A0A238ZTT9_9BACT|nr:hypothetical protein [Humidesulfovibrio mexicanus]SNR86846.1 hypothetical protein SAMN04488503_1607 [Humidesulfovibrio mexicanus]
MELLALSDIAKRTGIPAPTARRYAALFKDFLSGRRMGRMTRYPEASEQIFQRIADLYADGRITSEIEEILRSEYPRTIEVGPAMDPIALPAAAHELPGNLADVLSSALSDAMSRALSESVSQFADALDKLAEQKTSLDTHQSDITKLKNGFVLLARNLKRMARRDQADVSAQLAKVMQRLSLTEPKLAVVEEISLTLTSDVADLKARLAAQEVELRRLREDRDRLEALLRRAAARQG